MKITIKEDNNLSGMSAAMCRSTFQELPPIKKLQDKSTCSGDSILVADSGFGQQYVLTLVDECDKRSPNTLYVSSDVKHQFYPSKHELDIK